MKLGDPTPDLTPTASLIIEVLVARARCGEPSWPFPTNLGQALRGLQHDGFVDFGRDVMPNNYRVTLTDLGRSTFLLDDYVPPILRADTREVGRFLINGLTATQFDTLGKAFDKVWPKCVLAPSPDSHVVIIRRAEAT